MKGLLAVLGAIILFASTGEPAQARRGASETQDLLFVASTDIVIEGETFALCQLVTTSSKMFINFWRSVESYALATNNCVSNEYVALSAEDMAAGIEQGVFPADIPIEPKLSVSNMLSGMWGIGLGIGFLGFFGVQSMNTGRRRKDRHALMANANPAAVAILDAMCHAAKADGNIDDAEIADIIEIAREVTSEEFDAETVRRMIELAEDDVDEAACKKLIKPVAAEHRSLLMRAVLTVVAADGSLAGKEQQYVGNLMKAMKMSAEEVNTMLGEVVGGIASPAE